MDNSNLLYSARRRPDGSRDDTVFINIPALVALLEGSNPCAERVVVGSRMPESMCSKWGEHRFVVKQGVCVPGEGEKFVDEALHSCISHTLLDKRLVGNPQTLVLGTGDGNMKEGTNSFPELASAAARMGWRVVVWAWSSSISPRFLDLQRDYPDMVELHFLDDHRSKVTFRAASSPNTTHRPPVAQHPHPHSHQHAPRHNRPHF